MGNVCLGAAGVVESNFAEYLKAFTDQPAHSLSDLVDSAGYQGSPSSSACCPAR